MKLWTVVAGIIFVILSCLFATENVTINKKDDGYRGIWYMNQPLDSIYKYKYSGGLGIYCAKPTIHLIKLRSVLLEAVIAMAPDNILKNLSPSH